MIEIEKESKRRIIKPNVNIDKIRELTLWFRYDYVERYMAIQRAKFLGYDINDNLFSLENEAYDKDNELRTLLGKDKLPEKRFRDLI